MTSTLNVQVRSALTSAEPTIALAVSTFLDLGLLGKNRKTRDWYRKRLTYLSTWLGSENLISGVMDVDLLTWCAQLERQVTKWGGGSTHPQQAGSLSLSYRYSLIRAVKFFFRWLLKKQIIEVDPALGLDFPRLPKAGRKGISDADVAKFLELARRDLANDNQARDYALFKFLETTGVRLGGLCNLQTVDFNLDQPEPLCRRATVREKNDKERAVFLTVAAMEAMQAWLAVRPDVGDDHVFLGHTTGREWHALTESGIYGIVKRYAQSAGVKRNWSPHQWRHRFGRKLAERGVSLGIIAQIMGHEDVSITVRFYGIFGVAELQAVYDDRMPDVV